MNIKFYLRQAVKWSIQNIVLPPVYRAACLRHRRVDPKYVILADAHHDGLPDSMRTMEKALRAAGLRVEIMTLDYQRNSAGKVLKHILRFMDGYAQAGCIVLSDYFLPAFSCRKRKTTRVVQLWHACGAFKKFGYDSTEDIPSGFSRNMFGNLSLVTVSSERCAGHYADAFHIPADRVKATGISRTDKYFDPSYLASCRERFRQEYPEAEGKKILLWAPTFRGNAALAGLTGYGELKELAESLGDSWFLVVKLHPHMEGKCDIPHTSLPIECLLPVADALISDFSSVIFEYSLFEKPMYLYAPDAKGYTEKRGIYPEAIEAMGEMMDLSALAERIRRDDENTAARPWLQDPVFRFCRSQMDACDGHSTERILRELGYGIEKEN